MSILSLRKHPKTFAEYEAFVAGKPVEERWELLDGEIYLQASPVDVHQAILGNLMDHLRPAARRLGPDCRAMNGVNVKVDHVDTYAPIPDILVRCGPLTGTNRCSDPIVTVEVLSPSTADKDREFKAMFYRTVPTLSAYLIVYADEPRVEIWQRADDERWSLLAFTHAGDQVPVPALDLTMPLSDIYAGTDVLSR